MAASDKGEIAGSESVGEERKSVLAKNLGGVVSDERGGGGVSIDDPIGKEGSSSNIREGNFSSVGGKKRRKLVGGGGYSRRGGAEVAAGAGLNKG